MHVCSLEKKTRQKASLSEGKEQRYKRKSMMLMQLQRGAAGYTKTHTQRRRSYLTTCEPNPAALWSTHGDSAV